MESCDGEIGGNKKRGANWTSEEEILLIEEVLKCEDTLFGKMKGCPGVKGKHTQKKDEMWKEITQTLNSNYKNNRDHEAVKKKFNNVKQRAKAKIDQLRRPKTGGGPSPPSLSASEDALMQAFDGRPQIVGLSEGIDTDKTEENESESVETTLDPEPSTAFDFSSTLDSRSAKRTRKRSIRDKIEEAELENLLLDNQKLKIETEKLKVEKMKLEADVDGLQIKKAFLICQFESQYSSSLYFTTSES